MTAFNNDAEREAWVQFAAGVMGSGKFVSAIGAAREADMLVIEMRRRSEQLRPKAARSQTPRSKP